MARSPTSRRSTAFIQQAREFAGGPYALALQKGERAERRRKAVGRPADGAADRPFDGLHRSFDLRVQPDRFRRELLRDRHQIIGRIDSRYIGTEPDNVGEGADYDPQGSAITGAFVAALNDYLFRDLGYKTPLTYRPNNYGAVFGGGRLGLHSTRAERPQQIADTRDDSRRCGRTRA